MSRQSRLLWRCRRGIRELDLLLGKYVTEILPGLDEDEQKRFEAFLEEPDLDILNWITGRSEPDNAAYGIYIQQLQRINTANPHIGNEE